jgi:hypothetical protein
LKKSQPIIFCLLAIGAGALLSGCKKHDLTAQVAVPSNVYIAGEKNAGSGVVWNADKMEYLTDSTSGSGAFSIFVAGTDVYIGGEVSAGGIANVPAYWKNGVLTELTCPVGRNNAWVNSIYVSGNNVYAAGTAGDWSSTYAILWLNGLATVLDSFIAPTGSWDPRCEATSVFVLDGDVYVSGLGHGGLACYWKNGVQSFLAAAAINTAGNAISVSKGTVYIVGNVYDSVFTEAAYWKNGVPAPLPVSSPGNSLARALYVSGDDLYVCGNQTIQDSSAATYWENGTMELLPTGHHYSDAYAIFVQGEDIYVAGTDGSLGCYWKNGREMPLADNAVGLGIYVK